MPRTRRGVGRSRGFSLVEALVALALAAALCAVLTRFVSSSRWNASKIREQIAIDVLSDSLVGRLASNNWHSGRMNGRSGTLVWRTEVRPLVFFVHARSVKPKKKNSDADGNQATAPGLSSISQNTDEDTKDDERKLGAKTGASDVAPTPNWIPYQVTTLVGAPSGRSHVAYTIRIGPEPRETEFAEADQR